MTKLRMYLAATLGGLLLTVSAPAQDERADENKQGTPQIVKASDLMGMDVKNRQGEDLGDVQDALVDLDNGEIVYIAIAHGQTLGVGGKYFAVPPKAFTWSKGQDFVGLDVRKNDFETAKGFNKDAWPNAPDQRWAPKGREGQEGQREGQEAREGKEGEQTRNLRRLSELKDTVVYGRDNEKIGDIDGAAIDMSQHKIAYLVVGYGGVLGVGEEWFAVPLEAFQYKPQNQTFTLNATTADFEGKKGFDSDNWPAQPDRRFKKAESEERPNDN